MKFKKFLIQKETEEKRRNKEQMGEIEKKITERQI